MTAIRRITFLVAPEQKSRLTNHARAAKLSVDEYVRNRALDDDELLKALTVELRASMAAAVSRVDELIRRLEERDRARAGRDEQVRVRTYAEFAALVTPVPEHVTR
ncbi:MAG: hypothetical protein JSS44_01665 [Proteobacteria bacterium]|nr:hypothetical protein [Pseudomonadota bacterium]MBS0462970.1 hypothetical protein [Pseudomonadota bacterium]MBS0463906.1 hypothetical protein [Pseudomonadota bacterium]